MEEIVPVKRKEVAEFRAEHGNTKIGEVTVGMVCVFQSISPCHLLVEIIS